MSQMFNARKEDAGGQDSDDGDSKQGQLGMSAYQLCNLGTATDQDDERRDGDGEPDRTRAGQDNSREGGCVTAQKRPSPPRLQRESTCERRRACKAGDGGKDERVACATFRPPIG